MADTLSHYGTLEEARGAAIAWLEVRGARISHKLRIEIDRLGTPVGRQRGVTSAGGPWWQLRLDYAPDRGPHYRVEYREGLGIHTHSFCFPGTAVLMARINHWRATR